MSLFTPSHKKMFKADVCEHLSKSQASFPAVLIRCPPPLDFLFMQQSNPCSLPFYVFFDQISVHSAQENLISKCWHCDDVRQSGCLSGPSYSKCSLQSHSSLYLWYKSAKNKMEEYSRGRKGILPKFKSQGGLNHYFCFTVIRRLLIFCLLCSENIRL